jgi:hypothetical protein
LIKRFSHKTVSKRTTHLGRRGWTRCKCHPWNGIRQRAHRASLSSFQYSLAIIRRARWRGCEPTKIERHLTFKPPPSNSDFG